MEEFAALAVIMLVGLAIPITLLFAALIFDLVVVLYAMFRFWHDRAAWLRIRQLAFGHGMARVAAELRGSIRRPIRHHA